MWKQEWLNAAAAFGLGYSVYRWWQLVAAGCIQMGVGGRTLLVRSASGKILAGAAGVQCLVRWPLDLLGNVRFGLQHRYRKLQGLGPVHPTIPAHGLLLSWRALLLIYWGT